MKKKHIVLFETKDYEWVAYSTGGSHAKRLLYVNKNNNIFYIFECDIEKQYSYTMKLKMPLNNYYDCKKINKYKEVNFQENDKYITINYKTESSMCFDVKYN